MLDRLALERFVLFAQFFAGPVAITAVAIMPWFLAGSLFPISVLPAGLEQISLALPWTHALALLRFGLMEGTDPGLEAIWHMDSDVLMASLSLAVLAAYAAVMLTLAVRIFHRKTMV